MVFRDVPTLAGSVATLVPLAPEHCAELVEAVQDGQLWRHWYTSIPAPDAMAGEIERRLRLLHEGAWMPFAVVENASGRAVGMTNYMNIDAQNRRVEIGATWYRERVQRSALNTECKLMLLAHAFGTLDCIAVEFRTHFFNRQSRAGIERLGAKLDGVLRSHQRDAAGALRDTCVYSIIASEWPTVRRHLQYELVRRGAPSP